MLSCLALPSVGLAFTLKSLVMPGRVAEAHAKIEDDCESCHETTEKQTQAELCFVCHTQVRDDVANGTGLHGRHPESGKAQCHTCHAEHEGRAADITGLDAAAFPHQHTDFPLAGAHATLPCASCHASGTAFRSAPHECSSCHLTDDVHRGTLGKSCKHCHAETAWARITFDHSKTRFPLTGGHARAQCTACHQEHVFLGTVQRCAECHRSDDVHAGRNGAQCGGCHTSDGWPVASFDHAAKTGFALRGSHQKLACESCHVQSLAAELPQTCAGCHESDDPHRGGLGASCGDCHGSARWADTSFDHAKASGFALSGAHARLACTTCHTNGVAAQLGRECSSCHTEDPHRGQLGAQCASCHAQTAWQRPIRFDHDLGAFPLLGKHAALMCDACHASAAFHDAGAACTDCHAGDDPHGGRFGGECAACHNPSGWQAWTFDHARQTAFPLTGAHAELACASCHRRPLEQLAGSPACGQCHRQGDPHGGRFGADCGGCHTTDSFKEARGR